MANKNKNSVAADALMEMDAIKAAIKEESKSTIQSLLKESVKDFMHNEIEGDDEDMEIQDNEKETTDGGFDGDESGAESSDDKFPKGDDFEGVPEDEPKDDEGESDAEVPAEGEEPEDGEESDGWSEFEKFKVDDDTYDLTGEKDYDNVVKVYRLLKDEDNVVVKKDGDKLTLKDGANDAEYVIDLGTDGDEGEEELEADALQESGEIAGIPNKINEKKTNRKTMKENKEKIFEVDLGYTDNYQKECPLDSNLSMSEPGKGKDWDKGIPKGTEKPWVGDKVKSAGDPYGKGESVNEGEEGLNDVVEPEGGEQPAPNMEEGINVGGLAQERSSSKSKVDPCRDEHLPYGTRHYTVGSDYKEVKLAESVLKKSEAILKENKELKATLSKVKSALQEALMVNVNLGKVTKLFLENTTTQKEKVEIINRFNEAKTIDQSNALYESIKRELNKGTKQNVMLESKSLDVKGSAINENKIYESQDLLDIKNFMSRMDKC